MTLDRSTSHKGTWWLPHQPRRRRPGTLSFRPDGRPQLHLDRAWSLQEMLRLYEQTTQLTILGRTRSGHLVTLSDGYFKRVSFGPKEGAAEFLANVGFLGANIRSYQTTPISELWIRVPSLSDWLRITGFRLPQKPSDKSFSFEYNKPEPIVFSLSEDLELQVEIDRSGSLQRSPRWEVSVTESIHLCLRSRRGRAFPEMRTILYRILDLLALLSGLRVKEEEMTFLLHRSARLRDKRPPRMYVGVAYSRTDSRETTRDRAEYDSLFAFEPVKPRLEAILQTWLAGYEVTTHALDLFFSTGRREAPFIEQRFLSQVNTLEVFHRLKNPMEPSGEYTNRIRRILSSVHDKKDQKWLKGRLRYAHEPSLRERMSELLEPFASLFGETAHCKLLLDRLADTRNYLTHYDRRLREKAVPVHNFTPYIAQARALMTLQCLLHAGLEAHEIREAAAKNYSFRQRHLLGKL